MLHPESYSIPPSASISDACLRSYDAIIIGAGVAGSALAYALTNPSRLRTKSQPPSVLLLERDLSQPDRIVGELLQPGGCLAIKRLGLRECLDQIDAVEVNGYAVYGGSHKQQPSPKTSGLRLSYPPESVPMDWSDGALYSGKTPQGESKKQQGRSFHHGRFVQRLRWKASSRPTVTVLQATATELVRCQETDQVIGVAVKVFNDEIACLYAPLTFVTDGCFSKFRRILAPEGFKQPIVRSHFVGLMLETPSPFDCIPQPGHGHVILPKNDEETSVDDEQPVGPVLVYQVGKAETRMLVDVPGTKVPSISNGNLKSYLERQVEPILPPSLLDAFHATLDSTESSHRPRVMPNSYLPPHRQQGQPGVILLGDSLNMRHPLTGGGMTVALIDVDILSKLLGEVENFDDWVSIEQCLAHWHQQRKATSTCINVLAQALYNLFGAEDHNLEVLKQGCLRYFELGGARVSGPISLLSALVPSPILLIYHFFSVAFYSIYIMAQQGGGRIRPAKVAGVFWSACVTILPVLWAES